MADDAIDPALRAALVRDEGLRLFPYQDTVGKWTIGVGRNLSDVGITKAEAMALLDADIRRAMRLLDARYPAWASLSPPRQRVLVNMAFNLGSRIFLFRRMLAAMNASNYDEAAQQMRRSKWATQVGARAERLATIMETGREA